MHTYISLSLSQRLGVHGILRFCTKRVLALRVARPARAPGIGETRKHTPDTKNIRFYHFSGHRKTIKKGYTGYDLTGLRPLRGRKPVKFVSCVCVFDRFPMPGKMSKSYVFCIRCVFSYFPRFRGLYQASNISSFNTPEAQFW